MHNTHTLLLVRIKRTFVRTLKILLALAFVLALCAAYARWVEPTWLCVKHVRLAVAPTVRVIHVSDIHFTGDTQYLEKVVAVINDIDADFVCFTGDLIEEPAFLEGALHILAKSNKPIYGVPGNHDQWVLRSFDTINDTFRQTGGSLLSRNAVLVPSKHVALLTRASRHEPTPTGYKRILLEHQPELIAQILDARFDLALAGHTHGGQSRIPIVRQLIGPSDFDTYRRGLFQTPCGPLYVNPGIGTFHLKVRFLCRPEVTVLEL